jgi:uncharacterized protein (DUF58 family)
MNDQLVDPKFFSTLENLELIARGVVEGFLNGLHRSPYVGFSVEFASHREYLHGDDLRHLNWKLYGRQDKLYVKQYDAETNLDCHLVLDVSGSMTTSTTSMDKLRYASSLVAAIAHLALGQRDAVGLTLFADRVLAHLKPKAKSTQLQDILQTIVRTESRPRADSATVLHEVAELMPRRGMVVLASDLFYETAEVFSGLDHLRFLGHDVIVFQVLDLLERRLPLDGHVRFRELETGAELVTEAGQLRAAYIEAVEKWMAELNLGCRARGIDHLVLTTDESLEQALVDYLARRAQNY